MGWHKGLRLLLTTDREGKLLPAHIHRHADGLLYDGGRLIGRFPVLGDGDYGGRSRRGGGLQRVGTRGGWNEGMKE